MLLTMKSLTSQNLKSMMRMMRMEMRVGRLVLDTVDGLNRKVVIISCTYADLSFCLFWQF